MFLVDTEEGRQKIQRSHQVLRSDSAAIYKPAIKGNLLDSSVTLDTFEKIARRLIDVSSSEYPDAISLKQVYDGDPNIVFGVAMALATWLPGHRYLYNWSAMATADAGATVPLVMLVRKELEKPFTTYQSSHSCSSKFWPKGTFRSQCECRLMSIGIKRDTTRLSSCWNDSIAAHTRQIHALDIRMILLRMVTFLRLGDASSSITFTLG
jgi:hypothetical protein